MTQDIADEASQPTCCAGTPTRSCSACCDDDDRYGFEIYKSIRDATGGDHEIKEATLYATYRRLEKDGLVESYWGDETQGGRRKYYRITDAGRAVFRANVAAWVATRRIIDSLLDCAHRTERLPTHERDRPHPRAPTSTAFSTRPSPASR